MATEQEPIKIEIPVEEEEVVLVAERRQVDLAERVGGGASRLVDRGREVWESESRRQAKRRLVYGVRGGVKASRVGLVRGLYWLSERLAGVAERFTPVE